jgi:predicted MFS family arabinose efflux permease
MGVLTTGRPASTVVFYPLNAWLIVAQGWRVALVAFGCIGAAPRGALALRGPPVSPDGRVRAGGASIRGAAKHTH